MNDFSQSLPSFDASDRPPAMTASCVSIRNVRNDNLPKLALAALTGGDAFRAFLFADRWCRDTQADVSSLLLRATASHNMGNVAYALEDLERALEIEPSHRVLNRRMLEWGSFEQRVEAARRLITVDRASRAQSLSVLADADVPGVGELVVQDDVVTGWAAWRNEAAIEIRITATNGRQMVAPVTQDTNHPLAKSLGCATEIAIPFPNREATSASLLIGGRVVFRANGIDELDDETDDCLPGCYDRTVTIIVPVYDDAQSTKACLESVAECVKSTPHAQVLVIDDATPSVEIKNYLAGFAKSPRRFLRTNRQNKGYIGSINRGLRMVPRGDVILLNADTLVRPDFVDRLREAASREPDVGTVNPISNNGEFVSFPQPLRNNKIEKDEWLAIAQAAASANAGVSVDIPCGTGFCLYVTRKCLNAVGAVSTDFKNGYLEDADFGLRAREAGFRNICAPDVYVAHLGTRSFKSDKLPLIARNRKTLARKFPGYEAECRAFSERDPLKEARAAIEAELIPGDRRRLIIGPKRMELALAERARILTSEGVPSLLALIHARRGVWEAGMIGSEADAPKSLTLPLLEDAGDGFDFYRALALMRPDRVEIGGVSDLPEALVDACVSGQGPVDLLIVDASPLDDAGRNEAREAACGNGEGPCDDCQATRLKAAPEKVLRVWSKVYSQCSAVLPLDPLSASLATRLFGGKLKLVGEAPRRKENIEAPFATTSLGVIFPTETPEALRLIVSLANRRHDFPCNVFVLGKTSMDEALISKGVFVSGIIQDVEIPRVVEQYHISHYFLPYRLNNNWMLDAYQGGAPHRSAFFDYSFGTAPVNANDLRLDPRICDNRAVFAISDWLMADISRNVG